VFWRPEGQISSAVHAGGLLASGDFLGPDIVRVPDIVRGSVWRVMNTRRRHCFGLEFGPVRREPEALVQREHC
jgi:hypothetical protein